MGLDVKAGAPSWSCTATGLGEVARHQELSGLMPPALAGPAARTHDVAIYLIAALLFVVCSAPRRAAIASGTAACLAPPPPK